MGLFLCGSGGCGCCARPGCLVAVSASPVSEALQAYVVDRGVQLGQVDLGDAVPPHGAHHLYDDAGDGVSNSLSQLASRVGPSLGGLRRQARSVERAAFDHPAMVATVGLVLVGLVASLVLRSRSAPTPARTPRRQPSEAQPARSAKSGQRRSRGRNAAATTAH